MSERQLIAQRARELQYLLEKTTHEFGTIIAESVNYIGNNKEAIVLADVKSRATAVFAAFKVFFGTTADGVGLTDEFETLMDGRYPYTLSTNHDLIDAEVASTLLSYIEVSEKTFTDRMTGIEALKLDVKSIQPILSETLRNLYRDLTLSLITECRMSKAFIEYVELFAQGLKGTTADFIKPFQTLATTLIPFVGSQPDNSMWVSSHNIDYIAGDDIYAYQALIANNGPIYKAAELLEGLITVEETDPVDPPVEPGTPAVMSELTVDPVTLGAEVELDITEVVPADEQTPADEEPAPIVEGTEFN